MNKLTIQIEYSNYLNKELEDYLNSLEGVILSKVDSKKDSIYIEYDSSVISLKILKNELLSYLDIKKTPSIISFDKHTKGNTKNTIVIFDIGVLTVLFESIFAFAPPAPIPLKESSFVCCNRTNNTIKTDRMI